MKKILVPISFSATSKNALISAHSISKQIGAKLSLIHCYPLQEYNRKYDFEEEEYDEGIRKMMKDFYTKSLENVDTLTQIQLITYAGNISDILPRITPQYDLLVLSKKTDFEFNSRNRFSDKIFYFSTKAQCSILITPGNKDFNIDKIETIWHIKRHDNESEIIRNKLPSFKIEPKNVVTKYLQQNSFISEFWKKVITYSKTHDKILLKGIDKNIKEEQIDLFVVINHQKGFFEAFIKDDTYQTIYQMDIPILILQENPVKDP